MIGLLEGVGMVGSQHDWMGMSYLSSETPVAVYAYPYCACVRVCLVCSGDCGLIMGM